MLNSLVTRGVLAIADLNSMTCSQYSIARGQKIYDYSNMFSQLRSVNVASLHALARKQIAHNALPPMLLSTRGYATKKKLKTRDPNEIPLEDAVNVIKAYEVGNPGHRIELHIQCKWDKQSQPIRSALTLPKSVTDETRILVFAEGKKAEEAKQAGAQIVGGSELIEEIKSGKLDFDKCIATPDLLPSVQKIARILGPRGLMPTVKKGTVTEDIAGAVKFSQSSFDFRSDKTGIVHTAIARVGFAFQDIQDNVNAILEEVRAIGKAQDKKGFIMKVFISSTRGPSIPLLNVNS
ncbi:mitochondrial 54S ribosomal protein uL1m [Calcarisporiella thermophila]|uniref:mitochondrial 54S ribosomal protein uL1m n=1 Tax=Calcarisporiella thermophila TaxID=911321 RepID=UPI003743318E